MIVVKLFTAAYVAAVIFNYIYIYITICRVNHMLTLFNPFPFIWSYRKNFLPHIAFIGVYTNCRDWDWLYRKLTTGAS